MSDVCAAWRVVYDRYVAKQLIHDNPFRLHTVPQAVGRHACVIHGIQHKTAGSTFTLIGDNGDGLPLDSVYARQLDALRWRGRSPVEVGLLARRAEGTHQGARALFDMMRWAFYYTLHNASTDIVIGVHPHHARFYTRCFGMRRFARPVAYPRVNNNPVVPLRLPLRETLEQATLPSGLAYICDHPLDAQSFEQRFRFESTHLKGSAIARFLDSHHPPATKASDGNVNANIGFSQPGTA